MNKEDIEQVIDSIVSGSAGNGFPEVFTRSIVEASFKIKRKGKAATNEVEKFMKDEAQVYDYEIIQDKYFIGIYDVLFGKRIRGGLLFSWYCDFDVCCGDSSALLELVKELYVKKINKNLESGLKFFEGLKGHSEIKPIYRDVEYMDFLAKLRSELM